MYRCAISCISIVVIMAATLAAQDPRSVESKLGSESDLHPGSIILGDGAATGSVLLPELAVGVTGGPVVPQIQLRGGNIQTNDPAGEVIQIFSGFRPFVRTT